MVKTTTTMPTTATVPTDAALQALVEVVDDGSPTAIFLRAWCDDTQ